jgi:peptide/nickel transport system ATP-binding protein
VPDPVLEVRHLTQEFPIRRGLLQRQVGAVRAVDDVSFIVEAGETLSLVGESGCGKTTLSRCVLRALQPTSGEIWFRREDEAPVDLARLSKRQLRPLRRSMQMIFQDPFSSLDPRMTLLEIIGEPLLMSGMKSRGERTERVAELLRLVGLPPEYMRRFPHAFSGGQRQRVGIARALALNPRLVVADEAVSALDVSVQAQIVNLMLDLQDQLGLSYLFVAHDLSVVKHISDRVAVMYLGNIVELAPTEPLFDQPHHPYTEALLKSVPKPDPRLRTGRAAVKGEVPDAANPPPGCPFNTRCSYAVDVCFKQKPPLAETAPAHFAACHRADELNLAGVRAGLAQSAS